MHALHLLVQVRLFAVTVLTLHLMYLLIGLFEHLLTCSWTWITCVPRPLALLMCLLDFLLTCTSQVLTLLPLTYTLFGIQSVYALLISTAERTLLATFCFLSLSK